MGWGIAHLERSARLASASDFRDDNYGETPCDAPGRSPQSHAGLLLVALKRAEKDCGALPVAAKRGFPACEGIHSARDSLERRSRKSEACSVRRRRGNCAASIGK